MIDNDLFDYRRWKVALVPLEFILTKKITTTARETKGQEDPLTDSAYTRFIVAPGTRIKLGVIGAYADIEVPIFQNIRGYQLTAPFATKLILSYSF
jgi:hypothetical protein